MLKAIKIYIVCVPIRESMKRNMWVLRFVWFYCDFAFVSSVIGGGSRGKVEVSNYSTTPVNYTL